MWKKNILQKQVQDFKGSLLIQNISKNAFTFSQSMYWFLYAQTGNFTTVPEYFGDEFPYEFWLFSGMTGSNNDLNVYQVVQKAFVEVNEEGTEAAAATAACVSDCEDDEPPTKFTVDRPFLFIVRDNKSGMILFVGQVMDPSKWALRNKEENWCTYESGMLKFSSTRD